MPSVRYATVFAGLILLWPLVAILGGQGFTAMLALMAIGGIAYLRWPQWTAPGIWWLFIAWVAASSAWAPGEVTGDVPGAGFGQGNFDVESSAVRIGLTALAANGVLLALRSVRGELELRPVRWILGMGFVYLGIIGLMPLWYPVVVNLRYSGTDVETEGLQNALRAINALVLILPLLVAWAWHRPPHLNRRVGAVLCLVIAALTAIALGSQAALLALVAMVAAMAVVWWMPRSGFQVLFTAAAAYVLTAPFLLGRLAQTTEAMGLTLPGSFQSRAWSWQVVAEKIRDYPLYGYGLDATGTWSETYSDYPDWLARIVAQGGEEAAWSVYRVVPGHPHNMALEIWAETGLVGAGLFAFALMVTGFTAARPERLSPISRFALAGLFGAVFVYFSFAYSVWNEAFWASALIAAVAAVIVGRTVAPP